MKIWLLMLLLLVGCGKEIPETDLTLTEKGKNFTQITAKPVDDEKIPVIGGKDKETIIAVITVPASTIPTTVYVYDKPEKLRPRKKNEPMHASDVVSTNPDVIVTYPEITPWWYWWIGYLVSAAVVYIIGKKYIDLIAKPIGYVKKIWDLIKSK